MASSGGHLKGRQGKIPVVKGEWNWIRHGQVEVERQCLITYSRGSNVKCMQHDASILEA